MIASLSGTISFIGKDHLIIVTGGVGIRVFVPRTVLENPGGVGTSILLQTHLIVREQELTLYGFKTRDDLGLFEILLGVSGVGPKVALAILSALSPEMLQTAIMMEDTGVLQRVPGIGKKTAERIMFQLRDKMDFSSARMSSMPLVNDVDADVIDVLTGLGFSIVEVQSVLQKLPREVTDMNEKVGMALQLLDQAGR